jgi:hypothetical protein
MRNLTMGKTSVRGRSWQQYLEIHAQKGPVMHRSLVIRATGFMGAAEAENILAL